MVARVTRILLAIQLLAAAGIYLLLTRYAGLHGKLPAALLAVAIVLLVRMTITANNFGLSWIYRSETPFDHRLGRLAALRLFLIEYCASMVSSSWTMGFCTFRDRPGEADTAPVLLVHGYGCNSGYWHFMSRALSRAGIGHYGIDLEPMLASIDQFVPALHARIEEICRQTGREQIVIVAHSMGGLVARAYLRDHGARRVLRVVTLGTPHRGTGLARFGAGENVREMLWTGDAENGRCSAWLDSLARDEDAALRPLFISIFSHQDNIVSPQLSSHLPGARNIEFNGIGHVALGLHPRVQQVVIDAIGSAA
ncbi:esterase/lipase family protein [Noviherbaspirillum suwonense]|uniref:Alpha/beta hydrolase fold n=1 Tax=Noviherbaspirillum suwonense TaxID=1224511 RepID=A0ABY1Q0J9_9BURK|nr:alpha/beta fold hydrolase [Noviherbaspirillum suwonense]SMP54609.1 alpha/beta hydrolase fold [Noviherbaspirillum suwonense]